MRQGGWIDPALRMVRVAHHALGPEGAVNGSAAPDLGVIVDASLAVAANITVFANVL